MLATLLRSLLLMAICVAHATADGLSWASAEQAGFSADRLSAIDEYYRDKVEQGELPGIVLLIARQGRLVHFSAIGYSDVERKQKLERDGIFRLYSMTKPIAAVALMMLYEEGRFQMNDPVSKYLPEFADLRVLRAADAALTETVALAKPATMEDLLRHTAGFTHGTTNSPLDREYVKKNLFGVDTSLADMMGGLARLPLAHQPGTVFSYGVAPDVQARLVEVLSGMPFDVFLERRLFAPLGMADTGFWLGPEKAARLVPVHWEKDGKLVPLDDVHGHPPGDSFLAEPWSVNSYTRNHKRKGGSFGLAGTAEDYWRFAQMMANRGELNGTRILSPRVVRFMTADHTRDIPVPTRAEGKRSGIAWGLGFAVVTDSVAAGYLCNEGAFFWSGAAGTTFWVDPSKELVVVVLSQQMGATRLPWIAEQVPTLVYSALME